MQLHPKLAHLSEVQIEELVRRYYAEDTGPLLAEFSIKVKPGKFVSILPPINIDASCPHCEEGLIQRRISRSDARLGRQPPPPECSSCGHQLAPSGARCLCKYCEAETRLRAGAIEASRRARIAHEHQIDIDPDFSVADAVRFLSIGDATALLGLYRYGSNDAGLVTPATCDKSRPFAPTPELHDQIVTRLWQAELIAVDPSSPVAGFDFGQDNAITGIYLHRVHWRLLPGSTTGQLCQVMSLLEDWAHAGYWKIPEENAVAAVAYWNETALHECLQFFAYQGSCHRLPTPEGDKTKLMIRTLLQDFSVSQIYGFIWGAARDAAAYYQRGEVSKSQAGNSMVSSCRSRADRHRIEGWDAKRFRRNFDLPRSEISMVLHDTILGIGEDGFNKTPSAELFSKGDGIKVLDQVVS